MRVDALKEQKSHHPFVLFKDLKSKKKTLNETKSKSAAINRDNQSKFKQNVVSQIRLNFSLDGNLFDTANEDYRELFISSQNKSWRLRSKFKEISGTLLRGKLFARISLNSLLKIGKILRIERNSFDIFITNRIIFDL
ncbi:hypothetical protein SSS_10380 [Sarcoptes scabiei]|nr:hypothetical protein SSS_10380 [Sarcoptes scabiei]